MLVDEADVSPTKDGDLIVVHRGDTLPADVDRAARWELETAMRFRSVGFPDPLGPMIATNSPDVMESEIDRSAGTSTPPCTKTFERGRRLLKDSPLRPLALRRSSAPCSVQLCLEVIQPSELSLGMKESRIHEQIRHSRALAQPQTHQFAFRFKSLRISSSYASRWRAIMRRPFRRGPVGEQEADEQVVAQGARLGRGVHQPLVELRLAATVMRKTLRSESSSSRSHTRSTRPSCSSRSSVL